MPHVKRFALELGAQLKPENARKMTAKLLEGQHPGLVAAMMNYKTSAAGEPMTRTGFPMVQFGYYKNGFCLYGFGEQGIQILEDAAPLIHRAVAQQVGQIIQVQDSVIAVSAERRAYAMRYRVNAMVVQKKEFHRKWLDDAEEGKRHIENLFRRSIQRQAEVLGVALPSEFSVNFAGAKAMLPMFRHSPKAHKVRGLHGAEFDVNLNLKGVWSVGYQLGAGFGQFNATAQLGGTYE